VNARRARVLLAAGLLFAGTLALFQPVAGHRFLGYDDGLYVAENPHLDDGLGARGLAWALTTDHAGNWHPLTWVSHAIDVRLFGRDPRGHHLVNALLHAGAAALLLAVLASMTGALAPSALAAALFAVHPLHVESVAWVSERKDVLSGLCFFLLLGAYLAYARRPSAGRYALVAAVLAAGLMAKSMLVTAPFVLLLLDVWPLGRLRGRPAAGMPAGAGAGSTVRLLVEKVPLLALAGIAATLTVQAQRHWGALRPLALIPIGDRLANGALAAAGYLVKCFLPVNLVYFYPHPLGTQSPLAVAAAALALAGVTAGAVSLRRRFPWLAVGWFVYAGMLVPVSGLVQVGTQAMADRYTYLPLTGVFVAAAWSVAAAARRSPRARAAAGIAATVAVVALSLGARLQIAYWKDDESLYARALAVDPGNWKAASDLGGALLARGETDRAVPFILAALGLRPDLAEANLNLGLALQRQGRPAEAVPYYRRALQIDPGSAEAETDLGAALAALGRAAEARAHYEAALRINPEFAEARNNIGVLLVGERRYEEAEAAFRAASAAKPGFTPPLHNRAAILQAWGRNGEAAELYRQILRVRPEDREAAAALERLSGR
jgi:tetratricopeptide (TPR) repeat protein